MNASQVVIHFVGLVLFTTGVSNDPGLHAILPAIHSGPTTDDQFPTHGTHLPSSKSMSAGTAPASPASPSSSASPGAASVSLPPQIEPHVTLLIFREDVIANDSQWKAKKVKSTFHDAVGLSAYKYVPLSGEHITFIVNSPDNDPAELPPNMPRLSCATPTVLTNGYRWPYSQAAAVADIPKGALSVCRAKNSDDARVDTTLTLNTTGKLTVVAEKSGVVKTLVLNTSSNPTIYLVNIPTQEMTGGAVMKKGAPHFHAYYNMIGMEQTSTCSGPPSTDEFVPLCDTRTVFTTIGTIAFVNHGRFARMRRRIRALFQAPGTGQTDTHFPDDKIVPMANVECSNTQWP